MLFSQKSFNAKQKKQKQKQKQNIRKYESIIAQRY